jgi:hypothetical protein
MAIDSGMFISVAPKFSEFQPPWYKEVPKEKQSELDESVEALLDRELNQTSGLTDAGSVESDILSVVFVAVVHGTHANIHSGYGNTMPCEKLTTSLEALRRPSALITPDWLSWEYLRCV